MIDRTNTPETPQGAQQAAASPESLSSSALARRRLLLKGVGGGSAVLAAAAPLDALSMTRSLCGTDQLCRVSGMQSGTASYAPGTKPPQAGGLSPGYWKNHPSDWPCNTGTLVTSLFGYSKLLNKDGSVPTLLQVMQNFPNSDEYHWICAYLNALKPPAGYKFPYDPIEVLTIYNDKTPGGLNFFKTYLENV